MNLEFAPCYEAIRSRDPRFDGRFFTAVLTTGIYCRPICPARTPKPQNVRFFACAAAAEEAGFRPCKRCQPQHAPGTPLWIGPAAVVSRALALLAEGFLDHHSLEELAERLHLTSRHLRRLFAEHLGTSPVAVAQTRRLHFARQLLEQTSLSIIDTALAAGFSSLRRFNECFRKVFELSPSQVRRIVPVLPTTNSQPPTSSSSPRTQNPKPTTTPVLPTTNSQLPTSSSRPPTSDNQQPTTSSSLPWDLQLVLSFRPPYDWTGLLGFLALRAIPGVEQVVGGEYHRTVQILGKAGRIRVAPVDGRNQMALAIAGVPPAGIATVVNRVRRLFDLGAAPDLVTGHLAADPALAGAVRRRPGIRVPGAWDGFELAVRAVLGQQVTVAGATTLAGRLVARCGLPLQVGSPGVGVAAAGRPGRILPRTEIPGLTHVFPTPGTLESASLDHLGITGSRIATLRHLARAVLECRLDLEGNGDPDEVRATLRQIPGIGAWTAEYIAMRALRDPDAFPASDLGLRKALGRPGRPAPPTEAVRRAENWHPWRAYAAMLLWLDHGTPTTKGV